MSYRSSCEKRVQALRMKVDLLVVWLGGDSSNVCVFETQTGQRFRARIFLGRKVKYDTTALPLAAVHAQLDKLIKSAGLKRPAA